MDCTARVELRPSGGRTYAVVVEDYRDGGGRNRKRILRSFGNASDPRNIQAAEKFAAAYNAGRVMLGTFTDEEVKTVLMTILAGAAAVAVLKLLFDEDHNDDEFDE